MRLAAPEPVALKPAEITRVDGFVTVPASVFAGGEAATVLVFADGTMVEVPFTLLGPSR